MEYLTSGNIIYFCIAWLIFSSIAGLIAKRRDKGFMFGFLIGCIFGIFGIILILLFPKKEKKKYLFPESDRLNSKLKYYKIKEEFKEYKNRQVQTKS